MLVLFAALLAACSPEPAVDPPAPDAVDEAPSQDSVPEQRGDAPPTLSFSVEDEEMNAAMAAARASFGGLAERMDKLRARNAVVSIKIPLTSGENTEHIWLGDPEIRDGEVHGALGNVPLHGTHEIGDLVSAPVAVISDWMVVDGDRLYGGYTIIVGRARMLPEERAAFDQNVYFQIPDTAKTF